jgi:hypothetical protein
MRSRSPAFLALGVPLVAAAALPAQTVRERLRVEVITFRRGGEVAAIRP